jgi:hypothetical protein
MILLLFATLAGGALTFAFLWPYGLLIALTGAPLGAGLLTLCAALYIALRQLKSYAIPPLLEI